MSISRFGRNSVETGVLVYLCHRWGVIQRCSNSEEIKVSISEFMQNGTQPTIGQTYRYSFFIGSKGRIRLNNIYPVLRLASNNTNSVVSICDNLAEMNPVPNAYIEWFNWKRGYGAVLMMAEEDDERTAFLHKSVLVEALDEYGIREGTQLCSQEVRVVVQPDKRKDLLVTWLQFTETNSWLIY